MNRLEVQEVYNKVSTPRTISAIEALGLKACLFYDLFGTFQLKTLAIQTYIYRLRASYKNYVSMR